MDPNGPKTSGTEPKGMSLTTFFGICLVFLTLALVAAILAFSWAFSDSAKSKRQVEKLKQAQNQTQQQIQDAENKSNLALAQNRQQDVIQVARNATNVLGQLLLTVSQVSKEMAELKTNATGRAIAAFPDLVAEARRFYDDDAKNVARVDEVIEKLEGARRIEQQMLAIAGKPYPPDATVMSSAQDLLVWGQSQTQSAKQAEATLSGLVQESKVKVNLGNVSGPPTLEAAMMQVAAAEAKARADILLKNTGQAKLKAAETEAQGEAARILAQAESKKTSAELEAQKVLDDSQKQVLRQKASRPDVQQKLAPFLAPGYFSAKTYDKTFDKKPMSFSALRELGAFNQTMDGLKILARLGTSSRNDRPHLPNDFAFAWWTKPELIDQLKDLQQLMIELGPTFVDMGLMQP